MSSVLHRTHFYFQFDAFVGVVIEGLLNVFFIVDILFFRIFVF